jgi:tetratricopeptide (TPR) repeat protein
MFAQPSSVSRVAACLMSVWCVSLLGTLAAQENGPDEELARQQKVVERFVTVLEKNPRRGTALDRVYGFYVESGALDQLVNRYQDRAKDPKDTTAWMILGLIESQRGRDAAAVEAFTKAAVAAPKDPLPSYYLGQSLVLVGQPEQAVAAFEEAIKRKPVQNDLLEIFQALGRVHQRAQHGKEALEVWARLEKLFPGDARVQEQIAAALVEDGQSAQALPRYEALLKLTKDDYRKAVYRIEAAELKVKLNRSQEATADLEKLLATLNPTSWLHREVRRKIEEVYLRTEDQDGLTEYYQGWLAKNSEDVDAMARLARLLARQARLPEAQVWLDKALKLAPSRKELRQAFIQQLIEDQRYPDAIAQYELLDKADPNNPDFLREWGKLILRDTSRPKDERLKAAEVVWRRLLAARPKDPLIATQVADLFRHAEMVQPALDLYQKGVELAPDQPQYLEYLGEYYHQLKRTDEALATWRKSIAGKKRNAASLSRLAEVLASFGYLPQAIPEIQAACELDPKDFSLQLKAADLFAKAEKYPEALAALGKSEKLAQNTEESEAVLAAQLKIYQLEDSLTKRTEDLATQLAKGTPTAKQHFLLARYYEALRQYPEATRAIDASLKLEPQAIPALGTAARIYENAGDLKSAADLNRKLAVIDRRGRSDYLKYVAQLESQLGRTDEALKAGKELIASAPGNTENYEFYANLCFRLGQSDEGLQALRRAMRVSPNDPKLILVLAEALAGQYRTDEAIELYWQAFDKSPALDDRLAQIQKLTDLYMQTNHFDKILERLERLRRDAEDKREMTICLSQAYSSAGDFGMARQELESLLSENSRDTQLLSQLSKLSSTEGDLTSAVKYQEQLAKIAPGPETEYPLATLLAQTGAAQESAAILVRLTTKEEDPDKLLKNLDALIAGGQHETVLLITESKLREEPKNWELLYREGVALGKSKPDLATKRFQAILDLPNDDNEWCVAEKNRRAKAAQSKTAAASSGVDYELSRLDYVYQIRMAAGLMSEEQYYGRRQGITWSPINFAQARFAAIAWLYKFAQDAKQQQEFVASHKKAADNPKSSPRAIWDGIYAVMAQGTEVRSGNYDPQVIAAAKKLAAQGDVPAQYLFLNTLNYRSENRRSSSSATDKLPPLSPSDLELALVSYRGIVAKGRATDGTRSSSSTASLAVTLMQELKRTGRKDEEQKIFHELVDHATKPDELAQALYVNATREDLEGSRVLFDKWARAWLQETRKSPSQYGSYVPYALGQLMGISGVAKKDAEVLALLDAYLDYNQARSVQDRQKTAGRPKRAAMGQSYGYYPVWYGKTQLDARFSFPSPGEYFDTTAIQLLRNAYEVFQRNDVLSDLHKHLKERQEKAVAGDQVYAHLALAYVQAWTEDKEVALKELDAAAQLVPQDWQLRMDVARLHLEMQNFDEALTLVNSIAPLDQDAMRERETMALNLAVRLGDHERATQAAERLFGLRLDADTQIQLAGQMRRLGMNEQAEAVMSRAQRQAGSRLTTMVTLMSAHQAEGRSDVAVQIAYQILRRSRTQLGPSSRYVSSGSDDGARRSALQVMGAAGKLKEMIAATEEQVKHSPQATQLVGTLAEYYEAAGEKEKSLALEAKLVEQKKDDATFRYRYAQKLATAGKLNEACDQYKIVLKQQPRLLANDFYEVTRLFRQAKKEVELSRLLQEIDLRQMGQSYYVMNLVSELMQDAGQRPAAVALLKKALEAFPESRAEMFSNLYNEEIWDQAEIYEYGKQALIPQPADVVRDPWIGLGQINSYGGDGVVYSVFSRILNAATKRNELPKLREELAKAVLAQKDWKAGPLILAAVEVRLGNLDAARPALEAALSSKNAADFPMEARWLVGLELESREEFRDTVLKIYEGAMQSENRMASDNGFQYSPGPRLLKMYLAAQRRDDAKKLLVKAEKPVDNPGYSYPPGYAAERRVETLVGLASQYEQIEDSADALRLYREVLTNPAFSSAAMQGYGGNAEYYQRQARERVDRLTAELASKQTPELVCALLAPSNVADKPVLDLMLGVQTDKSGFPKIDSQLVTLVASKKLSAEPSQAAAALLKELTDKHPQDISVRIVAALLALRVGDQEQIKMSLAGLKQAVLESPLEDLPPLQRANSRQREAALRQVALCLVAAECLKVETLRTDGEYLFSRALEAASRQIDTRYRVALLMERAQAALQAGDKPAAKERLEAILAIALTRPQVKKPAAPMGPIGPPVRPAVAVKTPGTPAVAKPSGSTIAPITLSQFKLAMLVSHLGAEHGLEELAIKGARESLSGGLPVADANPALNDRTMRRPIMVGEVSNENSEITRAVTTELSRLSAAWRAKKYPPQEMYRVLEGIVFPPTRPDEILLYEESLSNWNEPSSLGRELVRWSLAAQQEESLRKLIASHSARPAAGLAGKVLLVFLAVESKQYGQAAEPLRAITQMVTAQQRPDVVATAAPAAARAFSVPELQEAALPLMQAATKGSSTNQVHVEGGVALLGKYYIAKGKLTELKAMHEAQLQIKLPRYAQYGGDYGIYQQRNDLAGVVTAVAPARNLGLTLEYLGRLLDIPASRDYGSASLTTPLSQTAAQLRALPASERYAFLRDWTLPAEKRRSVRFAAAFLTAEQKPAVLIPEEARVKVPHTTGLVSNFSLLVDAAKEAGKLDELQAAADAATAEKLAHAGTLQVLVALARNDKSAADKVQAVLNDSRARAKAADQAIEAASRNPRTVSRQTPAIDNTWDDIVVLQGAFQNDATREAGRQMFPLVRRDNHRGRSQLDNLAHLCRMAGMDALQELSPEQQVALLSPGLRLWSPGTPPQSTTSDYPPAWWTAHANHVTHIAGNGYDSLFFKYPLAGTFEFSFETHSYDCSQGEVAYGGLICHPQFWQNNVLIFPVSQHETVTRGATTEAKDHWNQYSVQVSPEAIRFYSNGHLTYEEPEPSFTSPWLHLVSLDHRRTDFRKLRLTGDPVIPRQVELIHGNRMEGWASSNYDRLPKRLTLREPPPSSQDERYLRSDMDEREPAWHADSGVLHGRQGNGIGTNIPAHLFYHRPLEPGETIRYEFLYEPGKTCVHPALGKLAFLLQPTGVQLKWISSEDSPAEARSGSEAAKLPLREGQWNEVRLSLAGNVASLKLNGELILEREMEPTISRQFGLFHYREQTAAQARNIVLSGNWPEKLAPDDLGNLLALASPNEPPQLQRARHALVREEELVEDAYDVWLTARTLPAEERYKLLAAWVLPSDQHPTFRLQAGFTPTQLAAPAVELVRAAAELKRLSELETAVREGAKQVAGGERDVLALQVLIATSTPDDATAAAYLKLLGESLKALDSHTPVYLRYPELVAAQTALQRPALRKQALAIAEALVENQQNNYQTVDWEKRVRALRAHARWLSTSQSAEIVFQPPKDLAQWTPVSFPTAEFRGKGFSPALWKFEKGKAEFFTGNGGDSLYFRSPLQGDFEVHFRRTTYGWKEMRMMYGATALDVNGDGLSTWRFPLARPGVQAPLPAKLPGWEEMVDCKLVVKDGDYRVFVGDTQIHTQRLSPGFDPWLAIQTREPQFDGRVENVQILGTPTVPDVLQLSAASSLSSWRADFYGETIDDKAAAWSKDKDEIVGKLHENSPGSKRESLLQYHRPLLEDGEIEYEFFYEAGKTLVHPALGRTAFLLTGDGVRLHQMTDGAFEKSGLTPENAAPPEGLPKMLPFTNKGWNRVKLSLAGDIVTISLAGEKIGEHKLSADGPRHFGLFRYSDLTSVRARNVTYRGNWPKVIPPPNQQELSLSK